MHLSLTELLVDLVNNAVEARASRIVVKWTESAGEMVMAVEDDGVGMLEETRRSATDPYFAGDGKHPGRKVGLGLPFMVQTAESTGGTWWLESAPGRGTDVGLRAPLDHVDLPQRGDIPRCFALLLGATDGEELEIVRRVGADRYHLKRSELRQALGEISSVEALKLLEAYVASQEGDAWEK